MSRLDEYSIAIRRNGEEYLLKYIDQIDYEKCIGCSNCVKACGADVLRMVNTSQGYKVKIIAAERCLGEGHCLKKCPTDALKLKPQQI